MQRVKADHALADVFRRGLDHRQRGGFMPEANGR